MRFGIWISALAANTIVTRDRFPAVIFRFVTNFPNFIPVAGDRVRFNIPTRIVLIIKTDKMFRGTEFYFPTSLLTEENRLHALR